MDSARLSHTRARLVRLRWRRAGAWLWPAFIGLTIADAVIGYELPPAGATESVVAAALLALMANLLGVLLLSRPLGGLIRKIRGDLPTVVARNYAGTLVVIAVTASVTVAGLAHRSAIQASQRATQDAIARAQAWIGAHAPAEFRRHMQFVSVFAIQPGTIYRACVPSDYSPRSYCVVVDRTLPLAQSVKFSGHEPNSIMSAGTG